jgi:hypothetical protein
MTDTRKEFEEWLRICPLNLTPSEQQAAQFAWQACQSINDKRIQQLLALVEKKNEALMLQASHMEMYSLQISHANDYAKITSAIDLEPEDVELVEYAEMWNHGEGRTGIQYKNDLRKGDIIDGEKLYKIQMKEK